jgi:hypothetical protein
LAHPPIHHRDRALRRLSLATKGVAAIAIAGTAGIWAAIAHAAATPTSPASGDAVLIEDTDTSTPPVPPASSGPYQVPVGSSAPSGTLSPPPAPPTAAPTEDSDSQAPPDSPEPTYSGGS